MPFEAPPWLTMQYQRRSRIPELLLESGRIQAEGAARSGAIWGGAVRDLGGIAAQGVQQYSETKKAEKAAQLEQVKEAALVDLFEKTQGRPSPMALMRVLGPEPGLKVARAVQDFHKMTEEGGERALSRLPSVVSGLDELPEPVRAKLYPAARAGVLSALEAAGFAGQVPTDLVTEQYDPEKWPQIKALVKGMNPQKPGEQFTLGPGQQRFGPDGQPIASVAPEPPKPEGPRVVGRSLVGPDGKVMYRDPDTPKDERLVQVMRDGKPTWVRESQAEGQPAAQAARAVTGQERTALAFYNRAKQASEDIAPIEDQVAGSGLMGQARLQYAPNLLQSKEGQAYRQAQRAFTEARLRKESGAAIPAAEYENDSKTYFAQPGDDPATIEQKRKAREVVLEGLRIGAGKAFEEYFGEPGPRGQSTTPKASGGGWLEIGGFRVREKK